MSNNLLLDDRSIVLLPRLACLVGDREAIFLQQIHYFNKDKDVDGDWFDGALGNLHKKYFPFWTYIMVRRIKDRLVQKGYLETKKRRSSNGDHTLSYRVNKKKLFHDLSEKSPPSMEVTEDPTSAPPLSLSGPLFRDDLPRVNKKNESPLERKKNPWVKNNPPTIKEVRDFFRAKNLGLNAEEWLDYWNRADWIDSKNNKILNWKLKAITADKYSSANNKRGNLEIVDQI